MPHGWPTDCEDTKRSGNVVAVADVVVVGAVTAGDGAASDTAVVGAGEASGASVFSWGSVVKGGAEAG